MNAVEWVNSAITVLKGIQLVNWLLNIVGIALGIWFLIELALYLINKVEKLAQMLPDAAKTASVKRIVIAGVVLMLFAAIWWIVPWVFGLLSQAGTAVVSNLPTT